MIELMTSYLLYTNDNNPDQDGMTMVAISFQFGDEITGQLNVKVDGDLSGLTEKEKIDKAKEKVREMAFDEQEE